MDKVEDTPQGVRKLLPFAHPSGFETAGVPHPIVQGGGQKGESPAGLARSVIFRFL
jgi:hypothetical protein